MQARETDRSTTRTTKACRLLLAAVFVLQQPVSTAVIVVDGTCGLADAITSANTDTPVGGCAAGAGADEIQLTGDVTLIDVLPQLSGPVTVEGNTFAVSRHPAVTDFRIFELGGGSVTLRNITVSNGHAGKGGGIYTDAPLTVVNSVITGNTADELGGGIYSGWDGPVSLIDSTVSDNVAGTHAGGVYAAFGASNTVESSTISGNTAGSHGGGVYNSGYSSLMITNSTISGNTAGSKGGGLYNAFYAYDIDLINTTIVGNSAANGGGFYVYPVFESAGTPEGHYTEIFFENSVIAGNIGGNCAGDGQHDLGGNFDDDGTCEGSSPIVADVDFDTALADNGGPTETHALLAGSVAINAGGACGLAEDQRGFSRDILCDSGAYEFGGMPFGLGGSATGFRGRSAVCRNVTTGSTVQLDLMAGSTWNCESGGFVANPGDAIGQIVNGVAQGPLSGSMTGIVATTVSCQNRTTGQGVTAAIDAGLNWDCAAAGLLASPGDRLRIAVQGQAP